MTPFEQHMRKYHPGSTVARLSLTVEELEEDDVVVMLAAAEKEIDRLSHENEELHKLFSGVGAHWCAGRRKVNTHYCSTLCSACCCGGSIDLVGAKEDIEVFARHYQAILQENEHMHGIICRVSRATWGSEAYPISREDEAAMEKIEKETKR